MGVSFWLSLESYTGFRNQPLCSPPNLDHTLLGAIGMHIGGPFRWKTHTLSVEYTRSKQKGDMYDERDTRKSTQLERHAAEGKRYGKCGLFKAELNDVYIAGQNALLRRAMGTIV